MRILLWPIRFIQLVLYFLWDLFSSSVIVAWDVLTPRDRSEPQLLLMPLDAETDAEIMATANLISLTPGTLTVDVAAEVVLPYVVEDLALRQHLVSVEHEVMEEAEFGW